MRSTLSSLLLFVAPILLLSCPERTPKQPPDNVEPKQVQLNREFELRVGERTSVEGESLKVKFVSVANDSRCPVDVTCVWAGNAEVLFQVETKGETADVKLNTLGADKFPKEARHDQYTFELVTLTPQPRKDKGIKSTDYVARLMIRKE